MEKLQFYRVSFAVFVFSSALYLLSLLFYYMTWVRGYDEWAGYIAAGTSFLLGVCIVCGPVALLLFFLCKKKKAGTILLLLLLGGIQIFTVAATRDFGKNVLTLTLVQDKEQDEQGCYVVIRNMGADGVVRLECEPSIYEQVETDGRSAYLLNYRVLQDEDEQGYLVSIEGECMVGM